MSILRRAFLLLLWTVVLIPLPAFAQIPSWLYVWPDRILKPPGGPSCYTITVGDAANMTVDLEVIFPWGADTVYGWTLDGNGQAYICADANSVEGQYIFTGVRNSQYPWWGFTPVWAPIYVDAAPPPPPSAQIPSSLYVSPDRILKPPGGPSCYTITVGDAANMTVDVEVIFPWGVDTSYGWTLDGNGQAYICADANSVEGQYIFTGVRNSQYPWWGFTPVWAPIYVDAAPPPPILSDSVGAGCDNWDCIWALGWNFKADSRVVVASTDWAHQQTYYGPAWGAWPPLAVEPEAGWLALQVLDPDLKWAFGWAGVYFMVVNGDGSTSAWKWVHSPQPVISSADPACPDLYCISILGSFPQTSVVDFRTPGSWDVLPNSYTDLIVTPTQITLRLTPSARYAYDTTGLRAWVFNFTLSNWSGEHYLPPVDRSVLGRIGGVSQQGADYYLHGWTCARTQADSIDIEVYVKVQGVERFLFRATANALTGPDVANACASTGSHHGFWVQIPPQFISEYLGRPLYVYGMSPLGLSNSLLNGSGQFVVPGTLPLSRREYIYLGDRILAIDTP